MIRSLLPVLILTTALVVAAYGEAAEKEILRLGTLLTATSDWGKTFQEMNAELTQRSNGELQLQIHFGRDEQDLVDLLRSKQFDAVSMTIPALGQIVGEVFIFQMPLLYSTYEELDYVRDRMTQHFSQQFSEKGFTLLGWGDLGYAYLFSKEPVRTQTDLQKTALWVMDSDIVARAFVSASGKEPVLLPVQSVLPSLTKNSVQTVYGPPLACIAFQWHTEVKYMTDLGLVPGVGATIMNKSRFEQLSSNQRRLLQEVTQKYHQQLIVRIRQRNQEAIEVLKGQGIEVIQVPYREKTKWRQIAGRVRNDFVGELYDKAFLDEVEGLLEEYHANKR